MIHEAGHRDARPRTPEQQIGDLCTQAALLLDVQGIRRVALPDGTLTRTVQDRPEFLPISLTETIGLDGRASYEYTTPFKDPGRRGYMTVTWTFGESTLTIQETEDGDDSGAAATRTLNTDTDRAGAVMVLSHLESRLPKHPLRAAWLRMLGRIPLLGGR